MVGGGCCSIDFHQFSMKNFVYIFYIIDFRKYYVFGELQHPGGVRLPIPGGPHSQIGNIQSRPQEENKGKWTHSNHSASKIGPLLL